MIALIAHDRKKSELVEFVRRHLGVLREQALLATGSTGALLNHELGLHVERVALGTVKMVIFFRDPLTAQPHEPDVSALLRVCDVHNVPLATNLGTAEMLLRGLASA